MAETFEVAPAFAFAELLTTTDVIGNPPITELKIFPIPCALNSRLVSVILLFVSKRSEASIHNKVSIDATMAMVAPTIQTFMFKNPPKSGNVTKFLNSSKLVGTGRVTKCSFPIAKLLPDALNNSFNKIPATTATKAPGSIFNFFKRLLVETFFWGMTMQGVVYLHPVYGKVVTSSKIFIAKHFVAEVAELNIQAS